MTTNSDKGNINIENENTFTFSDLFIFFKKLAPFILVSVLFFFVIGMSMFYIFTSRQNKNSCVVSTVIELTYPNADKGLLPDGSVLNLKDLVNVDNIQKSLKDIKTMTTSSQIKDNIKITPHYNGSAQNLLNNITIENSTLKAEEMFKLLLNSNIYPTQYLIELNFRNIGMLESDAKIIVDNLTNLIRSEVLKTYKIPLLFSSNNYTKESFQKYDFIESVALLSNQMYYINYYFNQIKEIAISKKYTGFDKFNFDSYTINTMIASFESNVILNGLAKNVDSAIYLLESEKSDLLSKKIVLDNQISSLESRIKDYELKMVILNEKGDVINGTYFVEAFEQMNKDLSSLSATSANTEERIATLSLKIDKYSQINENTELNSSLLEKSQEQLDSIISAIYNYSLNLEIETEKLYSTYENYVQVVLPAALIYNGSAPKYLLSAVVCLLLGVIAGIISYFIYMFCYNKKLAKRKTQ